MGAVKVSIHNRWATVEALVYFALFGALIWSSSSCGNTSSVALDPPAIDVHEFRIDGAPPSMSLFLDATVSAGTGDTATALVGLRILIDLRVPSLWVEISLPFLGLGSYVIEVPIVMDTPPSELM